MKDWDRYLLNNYNNNSFTYINQNIIVDSLPKSLKNDYFAPVLPADQTIELYEAEEGIGLGAMSLVDIRKDMVVVEYVGEQITSKRASARKNTAFQFSFVNVVWDCVIDAKYFGNESRYINHSCYPNCEAVSCSKEGRPCILLKSTTAIAAGDAITYDYFANDAHITRAHFKDGCKCGSIVCRYK